MNNKRINSTLAIVLQAGLLSFLGTIIAAIIVWNKEIKMQSKAFEYGLINNALSLPSEEVRDRLGLLVSSGLFEETNTDSLMYKVNYYYGKKAGVMDRRATQSFVRGLREFYLRKGRVPRTTEELAENISMIKTMDILENKIYYYAPAPDKFLLLFAGADGLLFTDDDKKPYTFDDLKIKP